MKLDLANRLNIAAAERATIFRDNARRLLKLPPRR